MPETEVAEIRLHTGVADFTIPEIRLSTCAAASLSVTVAWLDGENPDGLLLPAT
jgi:hypothetical protein